MAAFGLTALNTVLYFLSDGLQQPTQDSKEPCQIQHLTWTQQYPAEAAESAQSAADHTSNGVWQKCSANEMNKHTVKFACHSEMTDA